MAHLRGINRMVLGRGFFDQSFFNREVGSILHQIPILRESCYFSHAVYGSIVRPDDRSALSSVEKCEKCIEVIGFSIDIIAGFGLLLALLFLLMNIFARFVRPMHGINNLLNNTPGLRKARINQLAYSAHLIDETSQTWFDIVEFISNPLNHTSPPTNPLWLSEFLSTTESDLSGRSRPDCFPAARNAFNADPGGLVRRLEKFSHDLRTRDLAEAVINYCVNPADHDNYGIPPVSALLGAVAPPDYFFGFKGLVRRIGYTTIGALWPSKTQPEIDREVQERLRCWVTLQTHILSIIENTTLAPAAPAVVPAPGDTAPPYAIEILRGLSAAAELNASVDQSLAFLDRCYTQYARQENNIENSWKYERHRALAKVFREWEAGSRKNLRDLSTWLELCMDRTIPMSAVSHQVQLNICAFVGMVTGDLPPSHQKGLQVLRAVANERNKQWELLYTKIEQQQVKITKQHQIMTCLEYRHVLENLSDAGLEIPLAKTNVILPAGARRRAANPAGPGPNSHTGKWQVTWELAVRNELQLMIARRTSRRPPTDRPLGQLLQFDFDVWAGRNNTANLVTTDRAVAPPMPRYFQDPYIHWPSYQRGLGLYNLLSESIHGYGRSYDVDRDNWLKSDRLTFSWLKPETDAHGNVNWDNEWRHADRKGLPIS